MLKSCDSTQLDFIAEQCSQTDLQPLYLQPNIASFYTWIPAVGFAKGTAPKSPFSDEHKEAETNHLVHFMFWQLLLQQPGEEQCRYMCQSDRENFIVSRGSQFVDGTRCESDRPPPFGSTAACLRGTCQVGMTQQGPTDAIFHWGLCLIWICWFSAVSCLAATVCCTPVKWGMSVVSVAAMDPPARWPLAPSLAVRQEVAHNNTKLLNVN